MHRGFDLSHVQSRRQKHTGKLEPNCILCPLTFHGSSQAGQLGEPERPAKSIISQWRANYWACEPEITQQQTACLCPPLTQHLNCSFILSVFLQCLSPWLAPSLTAPISTHESRMLIACYGNIGPVISQAEGLAALCLSISVWSSGKPEWKA